VTARTDEVDGFAPIQRWGTGVRASGERHLRYELTVLAGDVEGVVRAAGGWLCDRARAGWQVTVWVPGGCEVRALKVLGVGVQIGEAGVEVLRHRPAALAIDAGVLAGDPRLRAQVYELIDEGAVEVTVWGDTALLADSALFADDARFERVGHRLSSAAKAFKGRALASGAPAGRDVEEFVSSALWYPPGGADLMPDPACR
jgi:hypothetical protein